MQELLLVNPRKRAKSRKPRSAAQKAATRRLVARNKGTAVKRAAPRKRRAKRASARRSTSVTLRSNPSPRRAKRRSSRRRSNPIMGKPMSILQPALMGALGATTVNTVLGQLSGVLPAQLMTGNALFVTKAAAAFALAILGNKMGVKGATVAQMAEGSLTVTIHDAILALAGQAGITQLSGMRAYMPRSNRMSAYVGNGQPRPKLSGVGNVSQLLPTQRQKVSGFGF